MNGRTDERTEIWTPISHPAISMGFAGVYLFFLFLLQNIDCGYTLEPPCRGDSNDARRF